MHEYTFMDGYNFLYIHIILFFFFFFEWEMQFKNIFKCDGYIISLHVARKV